MLKSLGIDAFWKDLERSVFRTEADRECESNCENEACVDGVDEFKEPCEFELFLFNPDDVLGCCVVRLIKLSKSGSSSGISDTALLIFTEETVDALSGFDAEANRLLSFNKDETESPPDEMWRTCERIVASSCVTTKDSLELVFSFCDFVISCGE